MRIPLKTGRRAVSCSLAFFMMVGSVAAASAQQDETSAPMQLQKPPRSHATEAPRKPQKRPPAQTRNVKPKTEAVKTEGVKTEAVKPAQAKPAATSAPENTAADGAAKSKHMLQGVWKLHWIDKSVATEMQIAEVYPSEGVTNFVGAMASLDAQTCPMTGSVLDNFQGSFKDGLEERAMKISAYVVVRALCKTGQIWVEALGVPSGMILMNGRATIIDASGKRSYATVGLGR